MDPPGMSLFMGAGSIHIDNDYQRRQEEEAAEDRRRLDKELRDQLENGFDDLDLDDDDDDDSINDSSKLTSLRMNRSRFRENNKYTESKKSFENLHDELSNEVRKKHNHRDETDDHMKRLHYNDNMYKHNVQYGEATHSKDRGYSESAESNPLNKYTSGDKQLQMLYEVRVREVQRLTEELNSCRRDATATHDALYGRLVIANAERERAELSLQQSQEIVENNKHHIVELEHKISTLSNKMETLQLHNEELKTELTAATASLIDAQNRLQAEKFNKTNVQTADAMVRAQQDRFKEDLDKLERDLIRTRNKLTEKENELLTFEKRYIDMERLKEDLLVEKGATINKLAMELEEAHCRIAKNDYIELNDKISHLTIERNAAKLQVKELANKLEATATELVETRGKLNKKQEEMHELESTIEQLINEKESDSFIHLKTTKNKEHSSQSDKINLLRSELTKSIGIQKIRKEQIDKLNKSLQKRDDQIENQRILELKLRKELESYVEKENKFLADIQYLTNQMELIKSNSNTDLLESLRSRCTELEDELRKKISELDSIRYKNSKLEAKLDVDGSDIEKRKSFENLAYIDLIKNNENLTSQLQDSNTQLEEFKKLYIDVCTARDKLTKEIEELKSVDVYKCLEIERANVTELLNQLKHEKLKIDDLGNKLLNQQLEAFQKELNKLKKDGNHIEITVSEIEENKKIIKELQEENSKLKEAHDEQHSHLSLLINELEESKHLIKQLNSEIELQEQKENLIVDLKNKAKQFEQLILEKQEQLSNRKNASTSPNSLDYIQNSESVDQKTFEIERLKLENNLREEIAHHFSVELKTMETSYNQKMLQANAKFNSNLAELGKALKIKTKEVETLQEFILLERAKFQEALSKPQSPVNQEELHEECKKKIIHFQDNINTLSSEVKRLKMEIETNPEMLDLKTKFLEALRILDKLKEKYKNVKKIASKYKEYINEKDKHVNSEIDRIKTTYEDSLKRMQDRLDYYINQKEQQINMTQNQDDNTSIIQNGKYHKHS